MRAIWLAGLLLAALGAADARADYVVFRDGRHLKVRSARVSQGRVEAYPSTGGRMIFGAATVRYITCDDDVELGSPAPASLAPSLAERAPVVNAPTWHAWADARFIPAIEAASRLHAVDAALIAAVIKVESDFRPHAVSPRGAQGLMQLMPATASDLALNDPFDPAANIEAGTRLLRDLLERYGGSAGLALAAYNAGPGAVSRHRGLPPYAETRRYVARVLELWDTALDVPRTT